jgi:hypothetical protein
MIFRFGIPMVGALVVSAGLFVASDARAGSAWGNFAYCGTYSGGGGICYGTLKMFRALTDANAYAEFETDSYGSTTSLNFYAEFNGSYFNCSASPSMYPAVAALWPQSATNVGYFQVEWDSSARCNVLDLISSSAE